MFNLENNSLHNLIHILFWELRLRVVLYRKTILEFLDFKQEKQLRKTSRQVSTRSTIFVQALNAYLLSGWLTVFL